MILQLIISLFIYSHLLPENLIFSTLHDTNSFFLFFPKNTLLKKNRDVELFLN